MIINLDKYIKSGDIVGVAVSGGEDSMALLHFVFAESQKRKFSVIAVNIEHGIRGEASVNDTEFVKAYCKKARIEGVFKSINTVAYSQMHKVGLEEAARILRYKKFFELIKNGTVDYILTAHHMLDNVESILINLFRGTSLKGVCGIGDMAFGGKIRRPMLSVSKEEIDAYIKENNIEYVTDETNSDTAYTRNFIRAEVLPLIKTRFPKADESIARFANSFSLENDYLEKESLKLLKDDGDIMRIALKLPDGSSADAVLQKRALVEAIKRLGRLKDFQSKHLASCMKLVSAEVGTKATIYENLEAIREYDYIAVYEIRQKEEVSYPFSLGEYKFESGKLIVSVSKREEFKKNDKITNGDNRTVFFVDEGKIGEGSIIRLRRDGDVFEKFGGGRKKLKSFLIDKKVPQLERDRIPIVACGEKALVFCSVDISDCVKIDDNTKNIIKIEFIKK